MLALTLGMATAACSSLPFLSPSPPSPAPVATPPPPRPEAPAKARPSLRPEQLTGLDQDETRSLLGPPTAESRQALATVWTYRQGECALSLMFYPEVETSVQRVLGYEAKPQGTAAACLNRLRESHLRHGK